MNTLTYKIKALIVAVLTTFLVVSCSDMLNAPPQGSLSDSTLNTVNGVEATLTGAYNSLYDVFSERQSMYWIWGDVAGGLSHKGSTSSDQSAADAIETKQIGSTNAYLNLKWTFLYEGITRANSTIQLTKLGVEEGNIPEDQANGYLAEARFLRGLFYFELQRVFGNIPWIDETIEEFNQPNSPQWSNIEADFQFAVDYLPTGASRVIGTPNRTAAQAFLGKVYLYQHKYSEANTLFEDVISNGVNQSGALLALADSYHANFNGLSEHTSEQIFSVEHEIDQTTGNGHGLYRLRPYPYQHPLQGWGFFQPTQNFVNSFRVDGNGHPLLSGYPSDDTWNSDPVSHDFGINSNDDSFTQDSGPVDPRLDWSVIRRGIPTHDWGPFAGQMFIRDQSWGGPYHAKKHLYWEDQVGEVALVTNRAANAVNHNVMRFADVLLMHAETEVEMVANGIGGSLADAMANVNAIRERVGDGVETSVGAVPGYSSIPETVENDFNLGFAAASGVFTGPDDPALDQYAGPIGLTWVVDTGSNSTYLYVGGSAGWIEYSIPTYNVEPYTPADFSSVEEARKRVHFERKLELGLEGHWYFDLVRWGEAEEYLTAYYQYEGNEFGLTVATQGNYNPATNGLWPIPQNQIDLTTVDGVPMLTQNPGY